MSTPPLLTGIAASMKHLSERQRVIAQNIANSETPGFKARDVTAPSFANMLPLEPGKPSVARPRIALTGGMSALGARAPMANSIMLDADTAETKPDGNNVTLEDQLLKMGQIQADFATMTGIYRKQMGFLKSAIGRG